MVNFSESVTKVINIFSPPKKESTFSNDTRNYNINSRSGGAKWPGGLSNSGSPQLLDHATLRQNARNAYHDTPQAKSIVDRYADTVVDSGLVLNSTPDFEIIGITAEDAEKWGARVSSLFHLWASSKKSHRAENMTFYQSQRLYEIQQQRDGEVFTRLYYSNSKELINPLQFNFVDPNQIRGDSVTSTSGFNDYNFDGIERDDRGREIKYNVYVFNRKKKQYEFKTVPAVGPKSKRKMMLHGFMPEYAGQGRGYSRLSHALQEFENITDFTMAQIKKAINQSNIVMYTKPSKENDASNPLEGILTDRGAGPASNTIGSNPTTPPESVDPETIQPIVSYCDIPEATLDTPGSTGVFNLNEGEDLRPFENTAPSDSFDKFVDAFTSILSASMSMPLEVLLMKFNQNYSASRAALILFWRISIIWREEMNSDYNNPIFKSWLSEEIAAGRVMAPGWSDPIIQAAWLSADWIGAPMPNIDPMKTAKADQLYAELGATDLDRISREQNGSSGKSNRIKLAKQYSELPIPPWSPNNNDFEDDDEEKGGKNG